MKKLLKAEMWDKMQYLFRNYYDRMMHCVLYYDGPVDEDALRRARDDVRAFAEAEGLQAHARSVTIRFDED